MWAWNAIRKKTTSAGIFQPFSIFDCLLVIQYRKRHVRNKRNSFSLPVCFFLPLHPKRSFQQALIAQLLEQIYKYFKKLIG